MPRPPRTVLLLNKSGGKNAYGASFLFVSQKGIAIKQIPPTTSIAMMLGFCQPLSAPAAKVNGISNKEKAAQTRSSPKVSISKKMDFATRPTLCPLYGDGGITPSLEALIW